MGGVTDGLSEIYQRAASCSRVPASRAISMHGDWEPWGGSILCRLASVLLRDRLHAYKLCESPMSGKPRLWRRYIKPYGFTYGTVFAHSPFPIARFPSVEGDSCTVRYVLQLYVR